MSGKNNVREARRVVRNKRKHEDGIYGTTTVISVLLYAAVFLISAFAGLLFNEKDTVSNMEVGAISDHTVTAPFDFTDEYSTNMLKQEAAAKVEPIYMHDITLEDESRSRISDAFDKAEKVRVRAKQIYSGGHSAFHPSLVEWDEVLSESDMNELMSIAPEYFTEQHIYTCASLEQSALLELKTAAIERAEIKLDSGILTDGFSDTMMEIRGELIYYNLFAEDEAELAHVILSNTVIANLYFDSEATEAAQQTAMDAVTPVTYKKDQNIIRKGEMVTQAQYEIIKQLGLTNETASSVPRLISGIALMVITGLAWILYVFMQDRSLLELRISVSLALLMLLSVMLAVLCKQVDIRMLPVFLPVIVSSAYLRKRTRFYFASIISFVITYVMAPSAGSTFSPESMRMIAASLLGSYAAVLMLRNQEHRGEYILAGTISGAVTGMIYLMYGITNSANATDNIILLVIGLASGVVCGLLSVGVLPIWETLFSFATPSKLLEIANPGHPLLKKLMIEAPGTYHHSIMVANLAEVGVEAVGGNALLARVSAYYHDIGKSLNPSMFKENQHNIVNPHDKLKPEESARIITKHVADGIKLAEQYKLPEKVRNIIAEHHGDGLVKYFYITAKNNGANPDEKQFRYPGRKPRTQEAGVLMLADVVEAGVRANDAIHTGNLRGEVHRLIMGVYDEGLLDDCPLTRRDMKRIEDAFIYVFEGANHERIVYPVDED